MKLYRSLPEYRSKDLEIDLLLSYLLTVIAKDRDKYIKKGCAEVMCSLSDSKINPINIKGTTMLIEHQHPHNRSIIASVIGAPNVGKSSLINYPNRLSIVTHKAQTTRNRFNCVFTVDRTEIIPIDTPGFHQSLVGINKE